MARPAPRGYRELGLRPALTLTFLIAPWPARCQVPAVLTAQAWGRYLPKGGSGTGARSAAGTQRPIPRQDGEGLGQSECSGGA